MLIDYIDAAMRRAKYELLADNEGFVGTIRGFRGLIGHGDTLALRHYERLPGESGSSPMESGSC